MNAAAGLENCETYWVTATLINFVWMKKNICKAPITNREPEAHNTVATLSWLTRSVDKSHYAENKKWHGKPD